MARLNRSLLALSFLLLGTHAANALTPAHLSSQRFGGAGNDNALSIAVDPSGNVYLAGSFDGTVDFGGGNLVSAGGNDIFVAKFYPNGSHQWSQRFGSTGSDVANALAVTATSAFVAGSFAGTVDFGGGGLPANGSADIFLAAYNTNGGFHQWSQRFGGTSFDEALALALDAGSNIYVTGEFTNTVNFGGGNLVSAGFFDVFLAKYNSSGAHQWSQRFGGTSFDVGRGVALDTFGSPCITGSFIGTANFGGANLVSAGGSADVFIARYHPMAGLHQWSQGYGGAGIDEGWAIVGDPFGNVTAIGYFNDTVNFGGGNLVSAGGNDIFLAEYNVMGAYLWSRRFGGSGSDIGRSIGVDAAGNIFTTGNFQGTVDLGGGNLVSGGAFDSFLAGYDEAGIYRWSRRLGSTGNDVGYSLAVNNAGNVIAAGAFSNTVDFGGGNLVSAGLADIYVTRYSGGFAEPVIQSISDVGNDQGRMVDIRFARSGADDAAASLPVLHYAAFRRVGAPPAASAWRDPLGLSDRELFADGWTQVGSVDAFTDDFYHIDVPTVGDSTEALGQYYSAFFIRAATSQPSVYFESPIDSGYSLDNLAPAAPQNLAYLAGVVTWDESTAADFDYFTVYGSNGDSFASAAVVDYSIAPSLDVSASPYTFYFVTATDFSGNEGNATRVNTLSGTGGTPSRYVLSVSNFPNPFNPSTTVRYTVPSRGVVTVAVYDARGAHVATLVDHAERAAGAYTLGWDGRSDNGSPVPSGVYFTRVEHASRTRSKKMVMLK